MPSVRVTDQFTAPLGCVMVLPLLVRLLDVGLVASSMV